VSTVTLDRVPQITQGAGTLEQLGTIVKSGRSASHVLLVADPGLKSTGMIATAERALRSAGLG